MRYFLFMMLMFLAGCGYHTSIPRDCALLDSQDLAIRLFVNKTAEPFVENILANACVEVFPGDNHTTVVPVDGDLVLEGEIVGVDNVALSYDFNDAIREYRLTLHISARLVRSSDGKYLWQGKLSRSAEYLAGVNRTAQQDRQRAAIREASNWLAADLRADICLMSRTD